MFFAGIRMTCLVVLIAMAVGGQARAEFRPRISVDAGSVLINGRVALRFQAGNGTLTPADRASITGERLRQLVGEGVSPYSLTVKADQTQARIYSGEKMICIVTAADAKANRANPLSLANSWVKNIRSLLLMPPIVLSSQELLVPLGENRSVTVDGAAGGPIYAKAEDGEVAAVSTNDAGRTLQVQGQKIGSTRIEISVEGERAFLTATVKKYAGRAAQVAFAQVSGNPCPTATICYAARQAVMQSSVLEPGTKLETGEIDCRGAALGPSGSRRVHVDVKISGEGYIPFVGKAVVEVNNSPMPPEQVRQLYYSNAPERLLKYQTLFAGKLELDKATRLLYHHQNAMGKRAHFLIDIVNPNDSPASFRVFRGVSSPRVDTVLVGYVATSEFLRDYTKEVSVIETVPAQSRLVLISDMLAHHETTSGVLEMRQMTGASALVRVFTMPPGLDDVAMGDISPAPNPLMVSLSDHIYPSPVKSVSADYVGGERWAFISIGKHAVADESAQKKLYGNYGVTYNISVNMQNPTSQTKKVSVVFDPSAGLASGVFLVDGAFVLTKYAKPPMEVPLASYQLKPGEQRNVRIVTLPVAGSNYPATLVVKS